jgi:hypothetical protein
LCLLLLLLPYLSIYGGGGPCGLMDVSDIMIWFEVVQ